MRFYSNAQRVELKQVIDEVFGTGTATKYLCDYACGKNDVGDECADSYFIEKEENGEKKAREALEYGLEDIVNILRGIKKYNPEDVFPTSESVGSSIAVGNAEEVTDTIFSFDVKEDEQILFDLLEKSKVQKALNSPEIQQFCADYLPHGFLTFALAKKLGQQQDANNIVCDFLKSPALRLFSLEQLQEWGVDNVLHTCEIVSEDRDPSGKYVDFKVKFFPDGKLRIVKHRNGSSRELNKHLTVPDADQNGTVWKPVMVYPGSVLDDVRQLSIKLADQYNWDARQVIDLLLTGRLLRYPPIVMNVWKHSVRITAPLFVSVDTLVKSLRDKQENFPRPRHRSLSLKHSALYDFMQLSTQGVSDEEASSLAFRKKVFNAWNEKHKRQKEENVQSDSHTDWVYQTLRLFTQDFKRSENHNDRRVRTISDIFEKITNEME